jgi:hypothetical protein
LGLTSKRSHFAYANIHKPEKNPIPSSGSRTPYLWWQLALRDSVLYMPSTIVSKVWCSISSRTAKTPAALEDPCLLRASCSPFMFSHPWGGHRPILAQKGSVKFPKIHL